MDLFTLTNPEIQKQRVRVACEGAGNPVSELAAMVEKMVAGKCSARQIGLAVRQFADRHSAEAREERAVETSSQGQPGPVWIAADSPEGRSWAAFYRSTRGKTPPIDRRGGWRFPTRFPPSLQAAE
jgi:hypothetical protein